MIAVLVALVTIPMAIAAHDLLRRPMIRRQALRNIIRHRGEALLVVIGTLLGTAIITASFVAGDSIAGSIRDLARTDLGPIDEVVVVEADQLPVVLEALGVSRADNGSQAGPNIENVDGLLVVDSTPAVITSLGDRPRGEPRARAFAIDIDAARNFGADPRSTGFTDATGPRSAEALIGADVADTLGVSMGDPVSIHMLGGEVTLTVTGILDPIGLAGRGDPVFVHPSVMSTLAENNDSSPRTEILISNTGGVFSGAALTDKVTADLEERLTGLGVEVDTRKANLLADATVEGQEFTTLFAGIGSFAVIAGVLLLVNLFTMLAEERQTDLGIMRAVGTKRNVVVRQLGLEGSLYAAVSAVLGVLAGVGVGWLIMQFARSLLEGDGLRLAFTVEASSLLYGGAIGLVISLGTVWITSIRLARLNIIRAIRQLREPSTSKSRRRLLVLGLVGFGSGAAATVLGWTGSSDLAIIAGPAIASFSTIPIFASLVPRRLLVSVASLAAMTWTLFVFSLLPDILDDAGISAFVVQGLVLVGGAVLLVTTHDQVWVRLAPDRISARLGLANTLARRTRTGLLLSMYALVIFMITFMGVFSSVFSRQADELASGISAGNDLFVDSSSGNPLSAAGLLEVDGVASVSTINRSRLNFTSTWSGGGNGWVIAGVEPSLFANGVFDVVDRDDRFSSDAEALESIFDDPTAIVVPEFFLVTGDGPGGIRPSAGDIVVATHPRSGRVREFEVAAVTTSDWIFTGPLVSSTALTSLVGDDQSATRAYVNLTDPERADELAAVLDARFIANGAVSTTFAGAVNEEIQETEGFIRILSGYLGLGLVIGVAGLGVVLIRGVRERRREIGLLRALGVRAATVRAAFLVEAGFVGALGGLLGTGLGLLTGYQVVTKSSLFGDADVSYVTPWTIVLIVTIGPFVASLLAAAVPAARAARLRPSEALRMS